jgi:hypothetical protein
MSKLEKKIFRKVVTLDEFYYQLKLMYLLLLHAVQGDSSFTARAKTDTLIDLKFSKNSGMIV